MKNVYLYQRGHFFNVSVMSDHPEIKVRSWILWET